MNYRIDGYSAEGYGGDTKVIVQDDFDNILDDIEKKVGEALDKIKSISGIEQIEECKEILDRLAMNLY